MRKRLPIAAVAAALTAATAVPAMAAGYDQPNGTTVSTASLAAGTRQLEVLDLAGNNLTNLALTPKVPQSFRVAVVDNAMNDLNQPFSVSAVMNNLYKVDPQQASGYDFSSMIPSGDVSIAFPASSPLSAFGVGLTDVPTAVVSGTIPNCQTLESQGLLSIDLTTLLTKASQLCGALNATTGLLSGGVLSSDLTLPTNVSLLSNVTGTVSDLADLSALPFDITGAKGGIFDAADYGNGIGAKDPAASGKPAGTPYLVLSGHGTTSLTNLLTKIGLSTPAQLVSATGNGAMTSLNTLLSALTATQNSTLQNLVSALSPLSQSDQLAILNQLKGTLSTTLDNLSGESGTYNAFPNLTVTPTDPNQAAGTYSGTLTITMVQQ